MAAATAPSSIRSRPSGSEGLVLALEDVADRAIGEDRRDRLGEQRSERQLDDVVRRAGRSGTVSVTTICSNGPLAQVLEALPENSPCVAAA